MLACGGGSAKPAAQITNTSESSDSSSSSTSDASTNSGSFGAVLSDIFEATYQSGTARVEFSGGKSASKVLDSAGGFTTSGATSLTFVDTSGSNSFAIALGGDQPGGIIVSLDGISSAGAFGEGCSIDVTKNTKTEFGGTVECHDIDSVSNGTDIAKIDVKATFLAKAGS